MKVSRIVYTYTQPMKMQMTLPYSARAVNFPSIFALGNGYLSVIVDSIVEEALEAKFPSWYEVPTTNVRNEPGESSIK